MGVLDKFLNAMKLNDDDYDDDDFLDDDIDEYEDAKPKKHFFNRLDDDDFDDYGYDESIPARPERKAKTGRSAQTQQPAAAVPTKTRSAKQQPAATSSKISPMRTTNNRKVSQSGMEVCVIKPHSMEDAREITETLLSDCTVVLNMEGLDMDLAQRIIDFSSGSCFAIDGNLQKISNYIFIITPSNVDISGDFQGILNGAFDVPSLHTTF